MVWRVTVLPVPVAPAIKPWRFAIAGRIEPSTAPRAISSGSVIRILFPLSIKPGKGYDSRGNALDGCREEVRQRFANTEWTDIELRAHVLRLAALGLMWDEIFQFQPMPPEARRRFAALLEQLARDWVVGASNTPDNNSH